MINLEIEATNIASIIDKPLNFPLKRRIVNSIITARANLLRQSIVRNRTIPSECIQAFTTKVEKVDPFSIYYNSGYKGCKKTKEIISTPLRVNSDTPFISVSLGLEGTVLFAHSDLGAVTFNANTKFGKGTGRYVYTSERIYLYHNHPQFLASPVVLIRGVFENPLDVVDYSGQFRYSEENFPMNMDMMITIKDMIRRGELVIQPENKEVQVDGDR